MEFNTLIEERRSMRGFNAAKKVSEETLKKILYAASQAPSWKNSQTARYYCILSDDLIKKFRSECLPSFNQNSSEGAALIVTTFVENRSGFDREGNPDNECGNGWGYYDLGMHNENFVLAAKNEGLDTLVMGIRNADKIREILDVPQNEIIVSVIALGYGNADMPKPKRKKVDDFANFF